MADNRTAAQRRATMQAVGTKDTKPELIVRKLLSKQGYRYRLHSKTLPGKPDIVFPGRRKAIFVHGCFWHSHGCKIGKPPKSRYEYWLPKLEQNKRRDRQKTKELKQAGWRVMQVWQCELRNPQKLSRKLKQFLDE